MHTDWRGYLATPIEIVNDYVTVMEGEVLAAQPRGKHNISDAPPGFDVEMGEPELLSWALPDHE